MDDAQKRAMHFARVDAKAAITRLAINATPSPPGSRLAAALSCLAAPRRVVLRAGSAVFLGIVGAVDGIVIATIGGRPSTHERPHR
jgi:hypothetical protein